MILPVALLLVAGAVMLAAPRFIPAFFPPQHRRPGGELVAWQVSAWSVVLCMFSALAMLSLPGAAEVGSLPAALEQCLRQAGSSDSAWLSAAGRAVVAGVLVIASGRIVQIMLVLGRRHKTQRRRQRGTLDLIASQDSSSRVWTYPSDVALVYCIPGRCARVVFTSAALKRLDARERQAVCEHEWAHLRWRHHHLLASVHVLASAFPRVRLFSAAAERTRTLVEIHADAVAARTVGTVNLMSALLRLSAGPRQPWPALNAAGDATAERVQMLISHADDGHAGRPFQRPQRSWLTNAAILAVVATAPVALSATIHAAFCWV